MRIRYFCHAGQETGYGRAATDLARALVAAGVDLEIVPLNPSLSHFTEGPAAALARHVCNNDDGAFDVAIVHTMPLDCAEVVEREVEIYNENDGGSRRIIAYTTWEGVDVPVAVKESLRPVFDDVWVPSTATQDAFLGHGPEDRPMPTFVLPHAFDAKEREGHQRYIAEMGTRHQKQRQGEPFCFRYVGAWTARKNVHGLIRAFARAFTPDDKVELIVHSHGVSVEAFTAALVATGLEQSEMPRVRLSNKHWLHDAMRSHEFYDCSVTATRGEAWNLPAFEAMLAGRMVIAPQGMGHDDFLFDDPEALPFDGESLTDAHRVGSVHQPAFVDVEMTEHVRIDSAARPWDGNAPAKRENGIAFKTVGAQGLSSRTTWRDPSLVGLANSMRSVFESKCRDLTLRYSPADRFGYAAVAKKAIDRIAYLLDRPTPSRKTSDDDE